MNENIYSAVLKSKLVDLGFSIQDDGNDILRLNLNEDYSKTVTVQLIGSRLINESIHGSHNRSQIKSIGYFRFSLAPSGNLPDYYLIFALTNTLEKRVEFIITPRAELIKRISKPISTNNQKIELQFWLMMNGYLFETQNIGAEGEFWWISGLMAIDTKWDYTSFLNNWEGMKMS